MIPLNPIVIIGASGHGKVVFDAARAAGQTVLGFLDRDRGVPEGVSAPSLGSDEELARVLGERPEALVVVAVGDNATRNRIVKRVIAEVGDERFATIVHPSSTVARDVVLGGGSVVMAGAVLNPGTFVGTHCIVNTGALIDHDSQLGDFVTVSPGAVLGGGVSVRVASVIGLGASVIQGVEIGSYTVLGAGAVVTSDLPPRVVAYGVPARIVRSRTEDEPYL
jgi:sugar O-acyltransferase (sialic acid O-acetyltransferase NeuD family)